MTLPATKHRYTPAEYYKIERDAQYKSDYYDGEIFVTAGGSGEHSQLMSKIIIAVGVRLRGKSCRAYESNLRLKIQSNGLRTCPDASVYCGPLEYDPDDRDRTTALNPTAVFEVLSASTEAYDRGLKSESYRTIPTLRAYALVAQDRPHVELYQRDAGGLWSLTEATGMTHSIRIDAIDVDLPLSEIYDRVEFPAHAPPPLPDERRLK